jgi:hypothetical protein
MLGLPCRLDHRRHMDYWPWPDRPYSGLDKTQRDASAWDAGALTVCARPVHEVFRWPTWAAILAALALAAFAIVAMRSLREPVLRAAGWALVVNDDPVAPADLTLLSLDSGGAGALEAADLVQSGVSMRVAVFVDPPSGEDHGFIRRGLP